MKKKGKVRNNDETKMKRKDKEGKRKEKEGNRKEKGSVELSGLER